MLDIRNFCNGRNAELANTLSESSHKLHDRMRFGDYKILLEFVDYDSDWDRYQGGEHEQGQDGSMIRIQIWEEKKTPHIFLRWLIAHEMRHAWQSIHDKFSDKMNDLLEIALKKVCGGEPGWKWKYHDLLPEEVDADTYADVIVGFSGNDWWDDVITGGQEKNSDDFAL